MAHKRVREEEQEEEEHFQDAGEEGAAQSPTKITATTTLLDAANAAPPPARDEYVALVRKLRCERFLVEQMLVKKQLWLNWKERLAGTDDDDVLAAFADFCDGEAFKRTKGSESSSDSPVPKEDPTHLLFETGSLLNRVYVAALNEGLPSSFSVTLVEPEMISVAGVTVPLPKSVNANCELLVDLRLPHDGNPLLGKAGPLHDMRDDVIRVIDDKRFAHILLVGSSGCGKTTTSFMAAKERYCLYLECLLPHMSIPRLSYNWSVKKLVSEREYRAIERRLKREVLARAILLAILHRKCSGRLQPYQWLLWSLSNDPTYQAMLRAVHKVVKRMTMDRDDVMSAVISEIGVKPSLVIDEAYMMVGERKVDVSKSSKVDAFGAVVCAVSDLFGEHLASCVWIGTQVSMEQAARLVSAVFKAGVEYPCYTFCSFPYLTREAFSSKAKALLGDDFEAAADVLHGRARAFATLVRNRAEFPTATADHVIAQTRAMARIVGEIERVFQTGFGESDLLDLWMAAIQCDDNGEPRFCPVRYGGTLAFTKGFTPGLFRSSDFKTGGHLLLDNLQERKQLAFSHIVDEPFLMNGIADYFYQKGGDPPHVRLSQHAVQRCVNWGGEPSIRGLLLDVAVLTKAVSFRESTLLSTWLGLRNAEFSAVKDASFSVKQIVSGKGALKRWLEMVLRRPDEEFIPGVAARNVFLRPETRAGADGVFAAFLPAGEVVLVTIACAWYSDGVSMEKWKDQATRSSRLERQFLSKESSGSESRENREILALLSGPKKPLALRVLFELPHRKGPLPLDNVHEGALVVDQRNVEAILDSAVARACRGT